MGRRLIFLLVLLLLSLASIRVKAVTYGTFKVNGAQVNNGAVVSYCGGTVVNFQISNVPFLASFVSWQISTSAAGPYTDLPGGAATSYNYTVNLPTVYVRGHMLFFGISDLYTEVLTLQLTPGANLVLNATTVQSCGLARVALPPATYNGTGSWAVSVPAYGSISDDGAGNYLYTPTATAIGQNVKLVFTVLNTCGNVIKNKVVQVLPLVKLVVDTSQAQTCGTTPLALPTATYNGTGTWTVDIPAQGSITGSGGTFYYQPSPAAVGSLVDLSFTVVNTCGNGLAHKQVQVNPLPAILLDTTLTNACYGNTIELGNGAMYLNGTPTWTVDDPSNGSILGGGGKFFLLPNPSAVGKDVGVSLRVTSACGVAKSHKRITINRLDVYILKDTIVSKLTICANERVKLTSSVQSTGSGPYSYLWSSPAGQDSLISTPTAITTTISPLLGSSLWQLTVTDPNGCTATSLLVINATGPTGFIDVVTVGNKAPFCPNSEVVLKAKGHNGVPLNSIQWRATSLSTGKSISFTQVDSATITIQPDASASVVVTARSPATGNCSGSITHTVDVLATVSPAILAPDNCLNRTQVLRVSQSTAQACAQLYWFKGPLETVRKAGALDATNPAYVSNADSILGETNQLGSFTYSINCITQANTCQFTAQQGYTIYGPPVASFTADSTRISYFSPTVHFKTTSFDSLQYFWDFGDSTQSILPNPTHTYKQPGTYTVVLSYTNNLGCNQLDIKTAYIVVTPPAYYFPTAFTPNADGHNDAFGPLPIPTGEVASLNVFQVFNREGLLVYEADHDNQPWMGVDGGGKPLPAGIYSYKAELQLGGGTKQYIGLVTLLR